MLSRGAICLLVALAWQSLTHAQERAATSWLPRGVSAETIGQAMLINGLTTDVFRLRGMDSLVQLQDAFVADAASSTTPQHVGEWLVLSRRDGMSLHTLQLRSDATGSPEALLASLDLSRRPRSTKRPPISLGKDAAIASVVESTGPGVTSTQYIAWSALAPRQLSHRLCARALAQRWQTRDCGGEVMELNRPGDSVTLVVAPAPVEPAQYGMRSVVVLSHLRRTS